MRKMLKPGLRPKLGHKRWITKRSSMSSNAIQNRHSSSEDARLAGSYRTLPPPSNSLDSFRPPPFGSVPEDSSAPQPRRRRLGCNVDVCNETVPKKALMSGRFAGLRPGLTASVLTTRKLSDQTSNTLMEMLRGGPQC